MTQNQLMKSSRCDQPSTREMTGSDGGGIGAFLQEDGNKAAGEVERSVAYMEEHIDKPLQVATLVAMANVSPSHFFALFKQRMGCSPIDYFTRLRMRRARQLLESTSARVKEIAAALGYDDPFYFSRLFKSVNGLAPTDYRKTRQDLTSLNYFQTRSVELPDSNRAASSSPTGGVGTPAPPFLI